MILNIAKVLLYSIKHHKNYLELRVVVIDK